MLTGVLVGLQVDEQVVRVTAVSEPYANVSVGATRRVTNLCQWRFRDPSTCGFNGSLLTCNFMLNNAGGCEGRHGTPLKQAKFGGFAYLNSSSRLKTG
jgi:phage-related protein